MAIRLFIIGGLLPFILVERQAALHSQQKTFGAAQHQTNPTSDPDGKTVTVPGVDKDEPPLDVTGYSALDGSAPFLEQGVDEHTVDLARGAG